MRLSLVSPGKQVQRVHTLLSKRKYNWPSLQLPNKPYSLTVHDVLKEKPGKNRDAMLKEWMRDVWLCCEHQHNW
jgi:ABC-type protease/lipase transport system fused ATPase/permease subunit